mmetsp:Transcript_33311/g.106182  ORF Transcript_33311/g.106182 Transcript_33311/m.106182 type:complete len:90 (+) Transcript_33311:188-457(+)
MAVHLAWLAEPSKGVREVRVEVECPEEPSRGPPKVLHEELPADIWMAAPSRRSVVDSGMLSPSRSAELSERWPHHPLQESTSASHELAT